MDWTGRLQLIRQVKLTTVWFGCQGSGSLETARGQAWPLLLARAMILRGQRKCLLLRRLCRIADPGQ